MRRDATARPRRAQHLREQPDERTASAACHHSTVVAPRRFRGDLRQIEVEPIAGEILMVDSPGANLCHTEGIAYRNLRPGVRLAPGRTA